MIYSKVLYYCVVKKPERYFQRVMMQNKLAKDVFQNEFQTTVLKNLIRY